MTDSRKRPVSPVTAESLRRDRERREKERRDLADEYDAAADVLVATDLTMYRHAAAHLRAEALTWRQGEWEPS